MRQSITPLGVPVGVDVHKRRCKVVEFNHGEIKVRKSIANTREEWVELLTELPPEAEIGLEVSTAGYYAMSVLEEAGWRRQSSRPEPSLRTAAAIYRFAWDETVDESHPNLETL